MTSPIRLLPMQLIHNFNLTTNINFSLTQHIMSFLAMHFTQRVTYVLILLSTVSIFQVVLSLMSHLLFPFAQKSLSPSPQTTSWPPGISNQLSTLFLHPCILPSFLGPAPTTATSANQFAAQCAPCLFFFSASNFQLKLTYFHLRLFLTSLIIPAICLSSLWYIKFKQFSSNANTDRDFQMQTLLQDCLH